MAGAAYVVVSVLAVLAAAAGVGQAIRCWECNSEYDRNCADPFENFTFALTNCDQRTLPHYPGMPAKYCRKVVQKVTDNYRTVRSCGWIPDEKEGLQCIKRAGTFNVLVQYCTCDHDGCNAGFRTASPPIAPLLTVPLAFALRRWLLPA